MSNLCPPKRPAVSLEDAKSILASLNAKDAAVCVLGIRNFEGAKKGKKNQRRVYDDAICLVFKDKIMTFNGNTDPSGYRKGHGVSSKKGMATLEEGLTDSHQLGQHRGKYLALVQTGGRVTVRREADHEVPAADRSVIDGITYYKDTGYFGINIHKGGVNTTSSEGCQTICPDQWKEFIDAVSQAMKAAGMKTIQYALVKAKA